MVRVTKADAELICRAPEMAAELTSLKAENEKLKQTLRDCHALMRFGKNDIAHDAPIWNEINAALQPPTT